MTLMKLAPEIVRLRRVAKAYAAGEFSRFEYREARREVIENFQPDVIGDDDTQPRLRPGFALEVVGRRLRGGSCIGVYRSGRGSHAHRQGKRTQSQSADQP